MATDLKVELRRLVELQRNARDASEADAVSWHRLYEAAKSADFAAVLQRLEELEAALSGAVTNFRCSEHGDATPACGQCYVEMEAEVSRLNVNVYQNVKLRTEVAKMEAENRRLREHLPPDVLLSKVIVREEID